MNNKYETQSINRFYFIDTKILDNLRDRNVTTLGDMVNTSSKTLRDVGLQNDEIRKIDIELQLVGLKRIGAL